MTDNELTKLIAEKVMGWEHGAMDDHITRFTVGVGCLLVSHPGTLHVAFAPLLSDNDAFQVVDKMIEKGWRLYLYALDTGQWDAHFIASGQDMALAAVLEFEYWIDSDRRRAICLAALKAVGVEVE